MAPPVISNVEALIGKVTSPLSRNEDPNVIQKICQLVITEPSGLQTAIHLIVHKMQSPQEWEAMQSLLILQSCVNNCGKLFHNEVGQFRFLNEMIKVVSPNYLGNHRPLHIKKRIIELLYTWTIDIPHQPKINDAYQMLKNQKIILEDPTYLGVALPPSENKTKSVFKDLEKSKRLQQLLQSKKTEDVLEANALIKKIVKDDERKLERSTQRNIEVETALTNASVLDEILSQYQPSTGRNADLDLMTELNDSCASIQTSIYRLVAELDDKEEGIGELLKANDELSRVMGRYKLKMKQRKKSTNVGTAEIKHSDEETLLDLIPRSVSSDAVELPDEVQETANTDNTKTVHVEEKLELISILDDPIFQANSLSEGANSSLTPEILIPEKHYQGQTDSEEMLKGSKPLQDIDLLGSCIIRQHLPPNLSPLGAQFKMKEKLSMNQLKSQQIEASQTTPISSSNNLSPSSIDKVENVSNFISLTEKNDLSTMDDLLSVTVNNHNQQDTSDDEQFISILLLESNSNELTEDKKLNHTTKDDCNNMNNLQMELSDIIPDDTRPPTEIINSNLMKVCVHRTLNKPTDDIDVLVVTTSSSHPNTVCNYNLHVICPEGCSARLLEPSSTTFSTAKPFMPSPFITQIILFSNPKQVSDDALRLILKYKVGNKTQADFGEFELMPS